MEVEGQDRIAISIAWPHAWPRDPNLNPAVAYVAAEAILSSGTTALAPQDLQEIFNDLDVNGRLWVDADHVRGHLTFPAEHYEAVIPIVSDLLANPQFQEPWISRLKT